MKGMEYLNACNIAAHSSLPTISVTKVTGVKILYALKPFISKKYVFVELMRTEWKAHDAGIKTHNFYKDSR